MRSRLRPRKAGVVLVGALLATMIAGRLADAKGLEEFVISGGDLGHPVHVTPQALAEHVHGMVWEPWATPPALAGASYTLDLYDRSVNPPRHVGHYIYYPSAGGALVPDAGGAVVDGRPIRWEHFSAPLQQLLNDSIASASSNKRGSVSANADLGFDWLR